MAPLRTLVPVPTLAFATLLTSCGGGSGTADLTDTGPTATISATPQLIGPFNNQRTLICGVEVAPNHLRGLVLSVHDGDTISVGGFQQPVSVRLDGIDAPELAQPFGPQARAALAAMVLDKTVVVLYNKNDRYGRVVGSVFTQDDCRHANVELLSAGLAWFYRAYQCELYEPLRTHFADAEASAIAAKRGLWAQANPQAPWVYRNGSNPAVPVCTSPLADLAALSAMPDAGAPTAGPGSTAVGSIVLPGSGTGGSTSTACGTKTTCAQMTSCAEAKQYLACGVRQLDADGDGVPCESLCRS